MQSVIRRPRVFVSSTINDFCDLRSAVRYWLEQAAYDVQLSEYTDFDRRPGDNVFEACFNNIQKADHYILMVGGRRGSWYDQSEGLPVTRQEFRVARDSEAAGTTEITVLVRSETETALQQWNEDGRPEGKPSSDRDLGFTTSFLAEVQDPAAGSTANRWTYSFSDFRDLIDALRIVLRVDTNIERRLAQRNLLDELLYNIGLFVTKSASGVISSNFSFATREREEVLAYDPASQSLQPTVEHEALVALYDDMLGFEEYRGYRGFDEIDQYFLAMGRAANKGELGTTAVVDSEKLALLLGLHDRMDDVFNALVQMALWLVGSADSPAVSRRSLSPIEGMSEQTEAERVSLDELHWALENRVFPFGEKLTPGLREVARDAEDSWFEKFRGLIPDEYMDDAGLKQLVSEAVDKLTVDDFPGAKPPARRAKRSD